MHRIHVVGTGPRTGTTLMVEAIAACCDVDMIGNHEDPIWRWPPRAGRIYLTKRPRDLLVAETALRANPYLYVICMIRDPRDMIVSKHRHSEDGLYWAGLNFWKNRAPLLKKLRGHPRFLVVRYEDLVRDPDGVQAALENEMPFLKPKAPFSRFHEAAKPSADAEKAMGSVRPISSSSIGNWRQHKSRVAGQLKLHGPITEDLIAFGYETGVAWEGELEGVAPDETPSYWGDGDQSKAYANMQKRRRLKALWMLLGHVGFLAALKARLKPSA